MSALPQNVTGDTSPGDARAEATPNPAPDAQTLVALARARLTRELDGLPPWGSPMLRARLLAIPTPEGGVSHGALVHFIRRATAQGTTHLAHELFAALLQRIEGLNRRWAYRTLASGGYGAHNTRDAQEELLQELALRLWEHIGRERHEAWELFFQRALTFEQRRLAAHFLDRQRRSLPQGIRQQPPSATDATYTAHTASASHAETWASVERTLQRLPTPTLADLADQRDTFAAAELADLRSHVARLPTRERQATLLRFWCGASEEEIAYTLGGVTTRTVRNLLTRAYARLRRLYAPEADPPSQQQNGGQHV